jgi:hypothetical protein
MPTTSRKKISPDEIEQKALRGENVSSYFTNKFTAVKPVRRVNVDLTPESYESSTSARRG